MREIRKESEVAVFCSSDQAAGKCFERGRYIASHTDVLRAGVGHAFLPHGGADTRDTLFHFHEFPDLILLKTLTASLEISSDFKHWV